MSLAGDILGLGLEVLRGVAGAVTGTIGLPRSSSTSSWTLGRIVSDEREPREGRTDLRRRVLEIQTAGLLSVTPTADARITFTGDSTVWVVAEAEPISPGGTVIAWRLSLTDHIDR